MIVTENIGMNLAGIEMIRTYSDAGFKVECDGVLYDEAFDPRDHEKVYTETDIPIGTDDDGSTPQHFWVKASGTDTGVHITEIPEPDFLEDPENGGNNIVVRSGGVILRDGLEELAKFSPDGIRIGLTDGDHAYEVLDYHSLRMIDKDGDEYLAVMDLRDQNGEAAVSESIVSRGISRVYQLRRHAVSITSVTVDGVETPYTLEDNSIWFDEAPADGSTIVVNYVSDSGDLKAYTLGIRGTGDVGPMSLCEGKETVASGDASHAEGSNTQATGEGAHAEGMSTQATDKASHAEGMNTQATHWGAHAEGTGTRATDWGAHAEGIDTSATGEGSHAAGLGTKATGDYQTTIGKYNKADNNKALIIGNGADDSNRSNILEIDWNGNTQLYGDLILDIPDPDYDVDIRLHGALDANRGTILNLQGSASGTNYKTSITNVGTPVNPYDAANKKYVDDLTSITWITGVYDSQGIVVSATAYDDCFDAITQNHSCYLKLTTNTGVHVLRLKSWINYNDHSTHGDSFLFVDAVNGHTTKQVIIDYNGATYLETELEQTSDKVTAWQSTPDNIHYPSEKLVKDNFDYIEANYQHNPVLIYDKTGKLHVTGSITSGTDSADGLLNQGQGEGTQRDISSWNITGMDLSAFRYLRVVFRRNNANYGTTGEFNVPLDGDPVPTRNIYISGATIPAYCDRNRLNSVLCAVSADKSKFCFAQSFALYGTAATTSSDVYVERIYGYY